jgi:hypothetical protein
VTLYCEHVKEYPGTPVTLDGEFTVGSTRPGANITLKVCGVCGDWLRAETGTRWGDRGEMGGRRGH